MTVLLTFSIIEIESMNFESHQLITPLSLPSRGENFLPIAIRYIPITVGTLDLTWGAFLHFNLLINSITKLSMRENANHFFPKSFNDAPR